MTDLLPRASFGPVLRDWRTRRHRSQLALANEAGVSQRHISFLETGRSNPSREMVVHLGVVLDVPLEDRNAMLVAAGFAPVYSARDLDDPEMADIRHGIDTMLQAHDPFPAYVVDRGWNLVLANAAALRLLERMPPAAQALSTNILELICHPEGLRTVSAGWEVAAGSMLRRLQSEVAANPTDGDLADLLDRVRSHPGVPDTTAPSFVPTGGDLVIPLTMELDGTELAFYTAITSLLGPADITLEALRLETLLPADPATTALLREWSEV